MSDDFAPLNVAILTSRSAHGLTHLLADPNRGTVYELAAVISSSKEFAQQGEVEAARVPLLIRPTEAFHHDRGLPLRSVPARSDYDDELASLVRDLRADYLLLDGYGYIAGEPLLESFPFRILAMHEADLTLRDESGERRYRGLHGVRDAVFRGERETRSSLFFVTRGVGLGPLFLLSAPFAISPIAVDARERGDAGLLTAYAAVHRRWMIAASWGAMLKRAIEFLAAGNVQIVRDLAWIDGVPGPCRMGAAPPLCREREATIDRRIPASCPLVNE